MNYDEYYFVKCDAVYVNRIVLNLHDSAFALSGWMTAVMKMMGMMIDMQGAPGYPHLL
jgi:hypothetical protein